MESKINFGRMKIEIPDNLNWLENRTILLTKAGSHIYGTNTKDSDTDYKGICIPPEEYYLGLKSINEYNKAGGKNFGERNTKNDIDITITHINKFVIQAIQGIPNNIDILFCRDEDIIYMDEFGKELREIRDEFLSKEVFKKFSGYALSQKHKLETKRNHGTGRKELVKQYSYDTKFAMHSLRLIFGATEILRDHTYHAYRSESERKFLLDIRSGKFSLDEIFEIFEFYDNALKDIYNKSTLKEKPDFNKINNWLIQINKRALNYDFTQRREVI